MKAILLRQHGGLEQVEYGETARPPIGPDEVLVAIKAAALNRLDFWVMEGWPSLRLTFPHVMGCDAAGLVAEVGANVAGFTAGDPVAINPTKSCGRCENCRNGQDHMCDDFAIFGEHVPGFYAEYQAVPARNLLKMPEHATFETAAAASLVYVTAWHSLIERGRLQAGEDILIVGAGGGVNTASIQIARLAGAATIYVVGSSEQKLKQARQLGADVTINRETEDWSRALFKATHRKGVDVVVDNVGAPTYMASLRALKRGGRLLTVGNTAGPKFDFDNRYIFGKQLSIIGSTMGPRRDYEKVMGLVFAGRLAPVVDTVYPLAEGVTALHRLQQGDVAGKLVLQVG
jgi:NADPH:quinone reductase-like Zn-dependent oxidoreductase